MTLLIKLAALIALLAVVVPVVAGDSAVGQLLRAAWSDVAGFCSRQPDACEEGVALARDAGTLIVETISELGGSADPGTLTHADRNLAPGLPLAETPHNAFAGHGNAPAP